MQSVQSSIILSASSLAAFAKCPVKFRLQYREGIRPAQDATALRMGTRYDDLFTVYDRELAQHGPDCGGTAEEYALNGVVHHLNERYATVPASIDPADWETERNTILALFSGYQRHWGDDPVLIDQVQYEFRTELAEGLVVQGKIDALGRWQGRQVIIERKTTSSSLDDSDYWGRLRNDVQVSMYALFMAEQGYNLPTLYDVTRKPTIRRGKKESPDEFFQRLVDDIGKRPEHYYARREIARTQRDLDGFRLQLERMATAVAAYDEKGCWWPNFAACKDPYPCPFASICHGPGAEQVIESGVVPLGFKIKGE